MAICCRCCSVPCRGGDGIGMGGGGGGVLGSDGGPAALRSVVTEQDLLSCDQRRALKMKHYMKKKAKRES
ncbi:Hypothetical predicted protein, partial [Scomber scombrus]